MAAAVPAGPPPMTATSGINETPRLVFALRKDFALENARRIAEHQIHLLNSDLHDRSFILWHRRKVLMLEDLNAVNRTVEFLTTRLIEGSSALFIFVRPIDDL